ncbi:MAG: alpha/beta fold hydrolase [Dehalococcoidia bacterium]|nr:alpha/beta fold hydrolase [Dehalococcoidia bacterium]
MTIAQINGIDIYYEEHGDADAAPVLMIMGFTGNGAAWAPQVPALAAQYHLIVFDNRGAGRTSQPEGPYSMQQMASDAAGVLDAAGVASAHIIGASMGGMIAQEFALQYPERVRTLVLACTTPGGPHSPDYERMHAEAGTLLDATEVNMSPERMRETMELLFTPEFIANPGPGFLQFAGSSVQYPASLTGMKAQMQAILAHDTYDRLPRISAPTLVVAGDADPLVSPDNSRILAARIPGARLRLLPGQRHGFTAEKPEETNAILLEFLSQHAPAPV